MLQLQISAQSLFQPIVTFRASFLNSRINIYGPAFGRWLVIRTISRKRVIVFISKLPIVL